MSAAFSLRIEPLGVTLEVPAHTTLLAAARQSGVEMRSSCRNGTCRECRGLLLAGRVAYRIEWPGLSADEKLEGWILPCVAYASSDLVLQAPQARRRG